MIPGLSKAETTEYLALLEEWDKLNGNTNMSQYADDPVGFIEKELHCSLTPDLISLCEAVVKYPVVIAKSGNGTGKSYILARLALWFFCCRTRPKVFLAAAPPEENLESILWSELTTACDSSPGIVTDCKQKYLKVRRTPEEFIAGVKIPKTGTDAQRQASFCADADDFFELSTGGVVKYSDLVGKSICLKSVDSEFNINDSMGEFFDNGVDDVYEIVLSSGMKIRRTAGHLLFSGKIRQSHGTHGGRHTKGLTGVFDTKWTKVYNLSHGDGVLIPRCTDFISGDNDIPENEVKIIAYMLGDGCMSTRKLQFAQTDGPQLDEFRVCVEAMGGSLGVSNKEQHGWHVNGNGARGGNKVLHLLRDNGLIGLKSDNKHVPDIINNAKKKTIAIFLSRIFSTDGWASIGKCGKYKKAEIGYVSKSEQLVRDLQRLLHRFSVSAKVRCQRKSWTHKGVKKYDFYWTLTISRSRDIITFSDNIGIYGKEEQVGRCREFAELSNPSVAWRESGPDGFIWDKVESTEYIGKRPTIGVTVPGDETYLTSVVEHNSGKHAPSILMGFDEGDAIPKPIYTGAETCLSGGFARMVIIYNPRERLGYVYQMVKDGRAYVVTLTAFNHPNVITGDDLIPGAVNREITLTRISQMSRPLAPDEKPDKFCYMLPDFLVGCVPMDQKGCALPALVPGWYRITDHSFSHIVLGEYPAQADNQLISEEWLDAARSRYDLFTAKYGVIVPEHVRCTAGLDIAEMGEDTTVLYKRFGNFVHPPRQWAKHDVIEVAGLVADDLQGVSLAAINCDGNGIGAGVAPYLVMAYNFPAVGIKGHSAASDDSKGQFKSIDDQMMWEMREWLRTDLAMLPPRHELLEELLCYSFERKAGKIIVSNSDKVKEKLGRSPDDAMGLKFTFAPRGMFSDSDLS